MKANFPAAAVFLWAAMPCPAAHLSDSAAQAFDRYIAGVEARLERQHSSPDSYLSQPVADLPLSGEIAITPVNGGSWSESGALIHHWRAAAFVPGATADDLLALLHDSAHLARYYAPDVVSARPIPGGVAMGFKKQRIVTVVLDAEFATRSVADSRRGYSISRSTHIWQVERPGTPAERRLPERSGDGYLWRLNSYWSFAQTGGGLVMECEAVSLTRDVPAGLGWLIMPIVQSLPRTSLEFTLTATRKALVASTTQEAHR
jgi:hypothetical protein